MSSLYQVAHTLGLSRLLTLRKAKKSAWDKLIAAHFVTRSIQSLFKIGLLDEMAKRGSVDVYEFAQENDLDAELLAAVCASLYARSILKRESERRYSLDEQGDFLVRNDLSRGWFQLADGYETVLYRLEDLLRKKVRYGVDFSRDGQLVAVGSGLASRDFYFPLVIEKLRRQRFRRVLDVGCGDGEFLRLTCQRIPDVTGVGLDLCPDAVAVGTAHAMRAGLGERVSLHAGDALQLRDHRQALGPIDAAATFFVLHEFCGGKHKRAIAFLRSFRETYPGVPFLITETIRPTPEEMRSRPGPAIEYFLFHDLSGQRPVDRSTWKDIFRQAGFHKIDEDYIAFARTSIFTIA